MSDYSREAQMVLDELSVEEKKQIRAENPFRRERDQKIRELYERGVKHTILSEITGLSKSTIGRIGQDKEARRFRWG